MNHRTVLASAAIVGVVLLEIVALHKGVNGLALNAAIGALCAIFGLYVGKGIKKQ